MARRVKKERRARQPATARGARPSKSREGHAPARPKLPDGPPPAPWGSFPLMQLAVLAGIVLIVIGAVTSNATRLMIGLGLGSLGGLELAVREHFAGYRSHTTLLAGVCFVIATGITWFALTLVLWQCLAIGAVVFALGIWCFRNRFQRATGGLSYRLR